MRRKVSFLIAFVGVLGLMGFAPAADATTKTASGAPTTHRTEPGVPTPPNGQPEAVCAVNGAVTISNGVSTTPAHDEYNFVGTTITCSGANAGTGPNGAVPAEYDVSATGYTDGPSVNGGNHGETDARGWSWGKGDIDVTSGPVQCGSEKTAQDGGLGADLEKAANENYVEFTRVGSVVVAWGQLKWNGGCTPKDDTCFLAELQFTPTDPDGKVNQAVLTGAAELWSESRADCQGDKQGPKEEPKG